MDASVVVGQSNFSGSSVNNGGSIHAGGLDSPRQAIIADGKLLVVEDTNNRVLIWNTVPTTNGVPADVVIGQTSMSTGTSGPCVQGGQNLSLADSGLLYVNGKLFIADSGHNRVLVYNSIPTSNGASADLVIGQTDFETCTLNAGGVSARSLTAITDVASDGRRLFISDSGNNRILVFNTMPTTNGQSADVVVGQPDFSTVSAGTTQSKISNPRGIATYNGKLIVGERGNFRITIWNSIPSSNGANADVVLGQSTFTTATTSPPSTASTVHPFFMSVDGKGRLYVSDRNASRYLIWNSIPTSNNTAADIVIGQPNFSATTANNGGVTANSVHNAKGIFANDTQMVISDQTNNRVLIFNNIEKKPGLSLNNNPTGVTGNILRFTGKATVDSPNSLRSVQFLLNRGSFENATATDGRFDSREDEFSFEIDPVLNHVKDSNNTKLDGYTLQLKAINDNADVTDNLFYFAPFDQTAPDTEAKVQTAYPEFTFHVNKQRELLRDNLVKYQIQVRKGDAKSESPWEVLIDNIPVDFQSAKGNQENLQKNIWESLSTNNGVYETQSFVATFANESSSVAVRSKTTALQGSYQWKVVAIDRVGHAQETGGRDIIINSNVGKIDNEFPLAVLNISGLGNPLISSYNLVGMKDTYTLSSVDPIFYGIAWGSAQVELKLTEQNCVMNCEKRFSTSANQDSRFGINIPKGELFWGKKYTANLSSRYDEKYTELPVFTLAIGRGM